jgi:prepilin signal peptidase PulO-like enzyme (type II secretory pathway)
VPEDYWLALVWSRGLVFAISLAGLYVMQGGLAVLEVNRKARAPFLLSLAIAYLILYAILTLLIGIAANLVLYVVG